jgi:pimeloyl-ACP methyl ester carboxylesterase
MTQLHVERNGQGPSLLLLHGISSSRTSWSKQIDRLQGDFTCIAPDLPGYGDSPDPLLPGLDGFAAAIAGVLEGRSAHVVGVSFGALAALALARRHPALVQSLILSDATLGRARLPEAERERWLQGRFALASELASRSMERAAEIASPQAPAQVIEEIAMHMRRARPAGYIEVARAIAATDAEPWLREIEQPALVICGEDDGVTGLAVSQTLVRHLRHARLVTIAAAGHAPHIEQPDRFATAVRSFLAEAGSSLTQP